MVIHFNIPKAEKQKGDPGTYKTRIGSYFKGVSIVFHSHN